MDKFIEWFGWFGATIILLAYGLVSFSVITGSGILFQILNLIGAIGIGTVSYRKKAYQPAMLNVAWALIALAAIVNMFR